MADRVHGFKIEHLRDYIENSFTLYPRGVIPVAERYFGWSSRAFVRLQDTFRQGANAFVDDGDAFDPDLSIDYTPTQEVLFEVRVWHLALLPSHLHRHGDSDTSIDDKISFLLQMATCEYFSDEGPTEGTPAFDALYRRGAARLNEYQACKGGESMLRLYWEVVLVARTSRFREEGAPLFVGDFYGRLAFYMHAASGVTGFRACLEASSGDGQQKGEDP